MGVCVWGATPASLGRVHRQWAVVAGVSDAVRVGVLLGWVGHGGAIVAGIPHPVAVAVRAARLAGGWAGRQRTISPSNATPKAVCEIIIKNFHHAYV